MLSFRRAFATVTALLTLGALVLSAAGAGAVTVTPVWAEPGADVRLAFTVLNEQSYSSVERLEITLPAEHPIHHGDAPDKEGWDLAITRAPTSGSVSVEEDPAEERIATVAWTAEESEDAVGAGEAGAFVLVLEDLPEAEQLVFRAVATYSDGDTESWDAEARHGEPMPDRLAPVLRIAPSAPTVPFPAASVRDGPKTEPLRSEVGPDVGESSAVSASQAAGAGDVSDSAGAAPVEGGSAQASVVDDSQKVNAALGLGLGIAMVLLGAMVATMLRRRGESGEGTPAA